MSCIVATGHRFSAPDMEVLLYSLGLEVEIFSPHTTIWVYTGHQFWNLKNMIDPYYLPPIHPPPPPVPPPPYHHQQQDNGINTLFVSGLPDDVRAREIHNLFRRKPGFDFCQLKYTGRGNQVAPHSFAFSREKFGTFCSFPAKIFNVLFVSRERWKLYYKRQ